MFLVQLKPDCNQTSGYQSCDSFDLFLPHGLHFCFPTSFIDKRGWRGKEKVAYRRRRQYVMVFKGLLGVVFPIYRVRKENQLSLLDDAFHSSGWN